MFVLPAIFPHAEGTTEALLDASLLSLLAGPLLWLVLVRPMHSHALRNAMHQGAMIDGSSDAIISLSTEGVISSWNRGAQQLFGYGAEEIIGEHITRLMPPEAIDQENRLLERVILNDTIERIHTSRIRKDGKTIDVAMNLSGIRDKRKNLIGFAQTACDISTTKRLESAIQNIVVGLSSSIGDSFFDAIAEQLAQTLDADYVFAGELTQQGRSIRMLSLFANGQFANTFEFDLTGTPCATVVGDRCRSYPDGISRLFPQDEKLTACNVEGYVGVPLFGSRNQPLGILVAMFRDPLELVDYTESVVKIFAARTAAEIERKQIEKRLTHMAYHDSLTGLPNRDLVIDRLKHALARTRNQDTSGALLFIDLDGFKTINDSLGHAIGDSLLKIIGQRLLLHARSEDTVARIGGDEFIVLLTDLGQDYDNTVTTAQQVAERIQIDLSKPVKIAEHELHITPSVGIVLYPQDADTAEELLKHSDIAMYQAKAQGRNAIRFYLPEMQASVTRRLAMQNELHRAINQDELILHYQPQVDMHTGKITGMEALLRWQNDTHGLRSPAEFIPLAEESGLIVPIGEWVLEKALREHGDLLNSGYNIGNSFSLSVNVSPRQFRQPDFVSQVKQAIVTTDYNPTLLTLELTEGILVADHEDVGEKLAALKQLGIRLAIDDFGTGYSSLAYLKLFPLDLLKIDQSFVRDLPADPNDAAIVRAIIALAKSLNLQLVAEGVETENQLEFLRMEGCTVYQGYLVSRPLPISDIRRLLENNRENLHKLA